MTRYALFLLCGLVLQAAWLAHTGYAQAAVAALVASGLSALLAAGLTAGLAWLTARRR